MNIVKFLVSVTLFFVFLWLCYHVSVNLGTGDLFGLEYRNKHVDNITVIAIIVCTLLGSFLGCLYDILQSSNDDNIPWWNQILSGFYRRRTGLSLLATPLVVFFVFDQMYTASAETSISLFCFQSGFFWDRTFKIVSGGSNNTGVPVRDK